MRRSCDEKWGWQPPDDQLFAYPLTTVFTEPADWAGTGSNEKIVRPMGLVDNLVGEVSVDDDA